MKRIRQIVLTALLISLVVSVLEISKFAPAEKLNSLFYQIKFKIRGQSEADSSIVFIYIDDPAIFSLGGYPLKRTYYALLIDILTQLNVKAIAFDILLTEKNLEYPERDHLLVEITKKSGRVYFGGAFAKIEKEMINTSSNLPDRFLIAFATNETKILNGSDFSAPFDELLEACAGIGHLNYISKDFPYEIPLIISTGKNKFIPSLSLELARVYYNVKRNEIKFSNDEIFLGNKKIPAKDGKLLINYSGGTGSMKMYSFVNLVKSYDAFKSGEKTEINLQSFKDKIVFVGIYSEILGQVVETPFEEKFPSTGIHIMALNTIIQNKFLTETSPIFNFLLSLVLTFSLLYIISNQRFSTPLKIFAIPFLFFIFLFVLAIVLFIVGLSIAVYPFLSVLISSFLGIVYVFELERRKAIQIEKERQQIEEIIKEKENKIAELQSEIEKLKAVDDATKVISNLEKIYDEMKELSERIDDLSEFSTEDEKYENFEGIIYAKGSKMEGIVSLIKKVASSDVPVLITGENGVGKELVAMAIHKLSERRNKKFIPINCSAIPETLLESELFGYEKGAFTGATQRKKGIFEVADGGTIFLDEIADTSESFQTKILRILQSGEFNRIGGTEILKVDVRVIAATNRDIDKAVNEGKFREDLYYRLNVVRIHIPPLRERKEDISALVQHFLEKFNASNMKVSQAVMTAFLNYEWPGNIRQLESAIKRAIIFAKSDGRNLIQLKDLPDEITTSIRGKIDIEEQILNLLREKNFSHSSISETADELGLHRGTVAEYLRGICFRSLYECNFDIDRAVLKIAGSDEESAEKVRKKMNDYIQNLIENLKRHQINDLKSFIKSKYKNLPARYHFYLEEFARKFQNGEIKAKWGE